MAGRVVWDTALGRGMVVVALVRHGRTAWNRERRFLGQSDVPLDEHGLSQARSLASALPRRFDHVYASPLRRALQTAEHLHPDPVRVPDLAELDQGHLEGLAGPEALARFPAFIDRWRQSVAGVRVPGGETLEECRDRAALALGHLAREHRAGDLVGVVTHQLVIATLVCAVLGLTLDRWREHGVTNGSITVLAVPPGTPGPPSPGAWELLAEAWNPAE